MFCRRVHLSEKTASFLNGEFDLEPGEGDTRDDGIKMANIKTYFVRKVIKPVSFIIKYDPLLVGVLRSNNRKPSDINPLISIYQKNQLVIIFIIFIKGSGIRVLSCSFNW